MHAVLLRSSREVFQIKSLADYPVPDGIRQKSPLETPAGSFAVQSINHVHVLLRKAGTNYALAVCTYARTAATATPGPDGHMSAL